MTSNINNLELKRIEEVKTPDRFTILKGPFGIGSAGNQLHAPKFTTILSLAIVFSTLILLAGAMIFGFYDPDSLSSGSAWIEKSISFLNQQGPSFIPNALPIGVMAVGAAGLGFSCLTTFIYVQILRKRVDPEKQRQGLQEEFKQEYKIHCDYNGSFAQTMTSDGLELIKGETSYGVRHTALPSSSQLKSFTTSSGLFFYVIDENFCVTQCAKLEEWAALPGANNGEKQLAINSPLFDPMEWLESTSPNCIEFEKAC